MLEYGPHLLSTRKPERRGSSTGWMSSDPSDTTKLREILVQGLYRRAPLPQLLFIPILYMFYRVLAGPIEARPAIRWIFSR